MLLPIALAGCLGSEDSRTTTFMEESGGTPRYPDNYRPELLAFMRTYLNDPVGVRNAEVAEPVQRTVGGRVTLAGATSSSKRPRRASLEGKG